LEELAERDFGTIKQVLEFPNFEYLKAPLLFIFGVDTKCLWGKKQQNASKSSPQQ